MQVLTATAALIGAITGITALVWIIIKERRRVKVVFLGKGILLLNLTRIPINIDLVGFIMHDRAPAFLMSETFDPICIIPPEGRTYIKFANVNIVGRAKYAFASDMLGKKYRSKKITEDAITSLLEGNR